MSPTDDWDDVKEALDFLTDEDEIDDEDCSYRYGYSRADLLFGGNWS